MIEQLFNRLEEIYPELVNIRRDLHMYPELSHEEVETPKKVADFLTELGLEVKTEVGGRGVLGFLRGGKPGKTIALRADFDALPIQDEKEVDYKSKIPGVMHACGHDLHTAALLGVAKILSEVKEQVPGTIVFLHQFAEETSPGGAEYMIKDGCLDGVDVIYGAHVMSQQAYGTFSVVEGYASSAQDDFYITINGRGGHGSSPHETIDALVTGSQVVLNLQQIVSRKVNPLKAAVVTIGSFNSGSTTNVIPDSASIKGTVRTFDEEVRKMIQVWMEKIVKSTCEAADASYELKYVNDCPSIWNDPDETKRLENIAKMIVGEENVIQGDLMMGSEDFAYYQKEIPGVYFIVGGRNEELNAIYPHHHPKFDVDERSIKEIVKVFIGTVFADLENE
ncbi:amidohydrolase [Psychrobacillus sp. INOP01]|uniref:M20 metallopeptidase family protein n=1 Tax=Psychrobacillus sp. INOP01 TaxID=2829187 RepID=UPI001BA6DB92|nr:amidohydrolase [Psychrobacillus sp. INOP01]QUG42756.1 amidohydrolase [Psychrobacillus sp. INOP01]